jgi:hypothetical protein
MTCDRKKPSAGFWITVALVAVLVGYPLSFGPWLWAVESGHLPRALVWFDRAYDPIRWLIERSPDSVQNGTNAYLSLWLPAEPMEYHGP